MSNHAGAIARDTLALRGMWTLDLQANLVTGDTDFARLTGADPARLTAGIPVSDLNANVHPDDQGRIVETRRRTAVRGFPFRVEYRRLIGGAVRYMLAIGRPERNHDGQTIRVQGATEDISAYVLGTDLMEAVGRSTHATVVESCADRLTEARAMADMIGDPLLTYFLEMSLMQSGVLLTRESKYAE